LRSCGSPQRIVPRLDRPGGNVTGFGNYEATLGGKWLELLSEIAPGLKRAAIMFNPDTAPVSIYMPSLETAAGSLKITPIIAQRHPFTDDRTSHIVLGFHESIIGKRTWLSRASAPQFGFVLPKCGIGCILMFRNLRLAQSVDRMLRFSPLSVRFKGDGPFQIPGGRPGRIEWNAISLPPVTNLLTLVLDFRSKPKSRVGLAKLKRNLNNIGVRSFILSGAPLRYKTGHAKTRRFCA
jgi:hypothetical protein